MEKRKVAFITGIGGQDGSYLAEFLLEKGYKVTGIVRRASNPNTERVYHLMKEHGDLDDGEARFVLRYGDITDASSIRAALEEFQPDEVYNLAAQSQVGISFKNPISTFDINALGPLRILDAIRDMGLKCKFYQASSSEMFGVSPPPQHENTHFQPQSPYGIAKVSAYHTTKMYRKAYGIFASNGILFNHESPRRGINFVTRKITIGIAKILAGEETHITLGNLDSTRDWGFSKEYVQAMWKILQQPEADDFVIATDETNSIRDFLKEAFALVGLNYEDFLKTNDRYKRPADVPALLGDPSKARRVIGWEPKVKFKELVTMMLAEDIKRKFEELGVVPVDPENKNDHQFYLEKGKEMGGKLRPSTHESPAQPYAPY
jgi:GDPmannose 4,6-dehydratase